MSLGRMARTVALLAGGASVRMGQDKALLRDEAGSGETWLGRAVRLALGADAKVLVIGRAVPLEEQMSGVSYLPDRVPGLGPLGGLVSALDKVTNDADVIACACDMPLLTSAAFAWVFERALEDDARTRMGVAMHGGGQIEPLFSLYRRACLPLANAHLEAGRGALRSLLLAGDFVRVDAPPWLANALANVNTPDEWEAMRKAGPR